ncbi:MAG: lipopolysaccharide assembly protein LapA domain-containing protein [bacterium]|nr:lipopolysaccharide assembly protein LapA domain-containing protein [bacterium]
MIYLITAVLFGLGFGYLATQNTIGVTLQAGKYLLPSIPLYLVVLASLLVGLFLAWFLSSIGSVATFLRFREKDAQLHQTEKALDEKDETILSLREKLKELAVENGTLKKTTPENEEKDEEEVEKKINYTTRPGFFGNFPQI